MRISCCNSINKDKKTQNGEGNQHSCVETKPREVKTYFVPKVIFNSFIGLVLKASSKACPVFLQSQSIVLWCTCFVSLSCLWSIMWWKPSDIDPFKEEFLQPNSIRPPCKAGKMKQLLYYIKSIHSVEKVLLVLVIHKLLKVVRHELGHEETWLFFNRSITYCKWILSY